MAVVEVASALGEWGITLKPDTPIEILDQLVYFGHVAISSGRVDPADYGDNLLTSARYVGVNLLRSFGEDNKKIGGQGMAYWLGDGEDKGDTIETPIVFPAGTQFNEAVTTLLPASLTAGTIYNQVGTYGGQHVWQSRRQALDYVASLFNSEWRVNGDGTVDAGRPDQLYITTPKAAILRNRAGLEMDYRAAKGRANLDSDVKDFTTRVLLLAEGTEATTVSATVNINPALNPYLDLHGNPVKLTRIISEQQTSEGNAVARAQLQLNRFTSPRDALKLTTRWYDIRGDVAAGDYVWVWDPEAKLVDPANVIDFQGEYITPMKLRVFQLSWPVERGMGVAFRDFNGNWLDITDWVVWESSDTDVVVGGYNRSLTGGGGVVQDPGSRPTANTSIPGAVEWLSSGTETGGFGSSPFGSLPFGAGGSTVHYEYFNGTYTSDVDGMTRAQIILNWVNPLNIDGSVITDGDRFEIRRRTAEQAIFPVSHSEMAVYRHNQLLGKQVQPIPLELGAWEYFTVGWGQNDFLMLDMTPGISYDFEIRAYDTGVPPNVGAWSNTLTIQTQRDTVPPADPAACEVASSKAAIQIIHRLGRATGGEFNLNADLNHFQVHMANTPDVQTNPELVDQGGTLLGKVSANISMIKGQIPVVASFQVRSTENIWVWVVAVDADGNESSRSTPVQSRAELWDDVYISNLSVSKVTAGFIQAMWVNAGTITTAPSGARVVLAWYGMDVFNQQGLKTLEIQANTGNIIMTGTVQSGISGRRLVMSGPANELLFFPELGETRVGRLFSYIPSNYPNDIAIEMRAIDSDQTTVVSRHYLLPDRVENILSPKGEGGDLLAKSAVSVFLDQVRVSARNILGVSGAFSSISRSELILNDQGHIFGWTNDASGNETSSIWIDQDRAGIEINAGGQRDGGFLWLGKGNQGGNYFGLHTADRDKYIRFGQNDLAIADSTADFIAVKENRIDHVTRGLISQYWDDAGSVHYGTLYSQLYEGIGNNNRVALKTDGGGHICFYWSAGVLNIGDHDNGAFIKTFVIDHPIYEDRHLVHATTESPVAGVEYSGRATVRSGMTMVGLPSYFEDLCEIEDRTVQLTVIADDRSEWQFPRVKASLVRDGRFKIYSDSDLVRVFWLVKAKRKDVPQFEVEPLKSTGVLRNVGPYTWREEL